MSLARVNLFSMYDQLCSWDNLLLAYQRASRGKRGHANVAAFEYALEDNLLALQAELQSFADRPGPHQLLSFTNRSAASFRLPRFAIAWCTHAVQCSRHALCNLIEPIFERSFIFDSYANRVGKGTHRALDRAQHFARRYPYVLACDIRQYSPASIMRSCVSSFPKSSDAAVLWRLIRSWQAALACRLARRCSRTRRE